MTFNNQYDMINRFTEKNVFLGLSACFRIAETMIRYIILHKSSIDITRFPLIILSTVNASVFNFCIQK